MKHLFTALILLSFSAYSQLNMTQLGHLDLVNIHNSDASDIWAYVDQNGNEYAIVGLNDGTSIVDISNPAAPVEVFYEPGMNSIWRDMKTFGDYAYITTEAQNGLLIIDLSSLPNAAGITTTYYTGPTGDEWESAHNLYIDENGVCYIFGANRDTGGCIMLDVATSPTAPIELGSFENWYAHDGVARGDTLYMGHINDGFMSIVDVSDKANPVVLGTTNTPGNFSHNLWFSDNGQNVFTTDEISNGYIGSYDISDPNNIIELDVVQSSPGMGVIPHNSHVIGNYLVTSYYRDGVVVHDISDPTNLVEVANFDSSPLSGDGFNGCWGAYPWLPSGNCIISDIETGLYILGVNYQQACYLEGNVTDISTTAPISNADITIIGQNNIEYTDLTGDYSHGVATAGTYTVEVAKVGYVTETINNVSLTNGNTTVLDVQLTPLPTYDITGNVGVENAMIVAENASIAYNATSDVNGDYIITGVYDGTYDMFFGKWGHETQCSNVTVAGASIVEDAPLNSGYYDDFSLDFNWTSTGSAATGAWERDIPDGTSFGNGDPGNPGADVTADCGDMAYVTGNGGGGIGTDDVDDADVVLTSPLMDISALTDPVVSVDLWWVNAGGSGTPDDSLIVVAIDGTSEEILGFYTSAASDQGQWNNRTYSLSGSSLDLSSLQIQFKTADWSAGNGHVVEAGVDRFQILSADGINDALINFTVYPNPSKDVIFVENDAFSNNLEYSIVSITGELMKTGRLTSVSTPIDIETFASGVYFIRINGNSSLHTIKFVKR